MAADSATYRRVPARGAFTRFFQLKQSSVWAADDHILSVELQWWVERYYRFLYRDVQVILLRKTITGMLFNVLFLAWMGLWWLATIGERPDTAVRFAVLGIPGLIALFINLALGPTCDCRIITAVQTRRLRGLRRLNTAQRAISELEPLLRAAQAPTEPAVPAPAASDAAGVSPGATP